MPNWYDITRDPEYQSLPEADRLDLKRTFFNETIGKDPEFHALDDNGRQATWMEFMQSPDDTGQGQITSALSSAARGFGEIVPGAIQGAGALTGITPLENAGEAIRSGLEYVTPVNPLHQDTVFNKGANVAGNIGSVLATGGVGGAIGKGLAAERIVAGATAAERALLTSQAIGKGANAALYGSAGLQGAASGAQSADQYGLTGANRYGNILAGAAGEIGSEMLPFGLGAETAAAKRLLGAVPRTGRAVGAIGSEAGEEGINQIWQNAALQALAPTGTETPGLMDGALEAAGYGALGGGILAGVNAATGAYKPLPKTVPLAIQSEIANAQVNVATAANEGLTPLTAAALNDAIASTPSVEPTQDAEDFEESLRANEQEGAEAEITAAQMLAQEEAQAAAEAQQRQAQFDSLAPNEQPIDPAAGIPVPQDGAGEVAIDEPAIIDEGNLGGGVLPTEQPETVGPAPQESLVGDAEGVERNRALIAQAAALNNGQIPATPIPSVFPQVSPQGAAPTGIATTTGQPMPGGSGTPINKGNPPLTLPLYGINSKDVAREYGLPEDFYQVGEKSIHIADKYQTDELRSAISELDKWTGSQSVNASKGKRMGRARVDSELARITTAARTATEPVQVGEGAIQEASQKTFDDFFEGMRKTSSDYTPIEDVAANAAFDSLDIPVEQRNPKRLASAVLTGGGKSTPQWVRSWHALYGKGAKSWEHMVHKQAVMLSVADKQPVSAKAVDQYGIKLPEGYQRQGELYVYQPPSPAATPTQETPLTPSGQVVNEGVVSDASSGTEAGVRVQPPVETKVNADVEASSGKVEAGNAALDDIISKLPPVAQAKYTPEVRAKAAKFFESKNEADLNGLTTIQKTKVHDALYRADKEAADAQKAVDKLYEKRLREEEKENARLEKERANQVKLTESRRKAYDSIIGTPSGVEMGAVSPTDGQEALAAVHNTGDVPGVLNAFVGTSGEFLANAENEKNFPALWQLLQTGRVDEGNFVYGRAFVFTDGIGINRMDRENAARYGTTPAVAAVRRVLVHESLVHRGIFGLPANLQARIIQWVMQNTSPESLDMLAQDYPQYENWRGDEFQMMALAEEYLAKTVENLNGMPKIGPIAHLVEILRDIWRWITGRTDEPTIQNLRDVVKLLKAGAQAADARLVNGGKVDIRESKPAFAVPINAELARAAERFRQMQERQSVPTPEGLKELFNPNAEGSGTQNKLFDQQVTPQQIRNEIRAAYDRALVGRGSVQVSLQRVFDEVKAMMPELTERQFGEQVQALYEDGSAFLVPTDRGADMLAAGEKWGVYDVSGQPASYVGIMPVDIKASRITQDPRSQLPKDVQQQAKVVSKLGPDALNSHRALKALRESQPKFHAKQESEPLIDVAVNIVESLEKNGVLPEELNDYLLDSDFLDELGIKMNDSLYQALTVEVYRTQLEKADELENEGDIAGANRMRERVIATHNQWFKSGTDAGQRLNFRQALMLNPRYHGLFLLSHLNEMLSENAEKTVKAQTEIKADDIAQKADQAASQATDDVVDEFANISMDELDRLGEDQLDEGEKSLWRQIKDYIADLGAIAIADLQVGNKDIKASNAAMSASDRVKKFTAMPQDARDKVKADTHAKLKAAMGKFMDKGTESKKRVKKDLVERAEAKQKEKKPRVTRPKLTAEEKAKKKQERADAVAQRLIYRTQEVFRQGFKNESKQNNADSILKAFRDQVATPVSDAVFIERVAKLNVTEAVAQRMLNTAERERVDHQRMEKNAILDSEDALKKLMHKLSKKLGVFQIDSSSWRKLFSTSTASQSQRRQEMEAAIKADPAFQNLDADDQQLLADLVDEAWEAQRKKVFESEIARLTRTKRTSEAGAKAVEGETEKLLQLVNLGLLTNDSFYKAVAEKFGFKDITQEQKNRLQKIAQDLQKDDLPPHKRTMLAEEFKDIVSDVAHVPFAQIAADTWVTSVLTGWRTAVTIALAAESGGYQVISTALAEIVKNTGDLNAWKTAGAAINAWISSMPRNARNALGYLWDGKADRLDPTMANLAAYMDLDKQELSRVNTANALLKSKNVFSRLLGHYLHFFQKFLTALDMFNAASAKQGSLPIAYYQTRKSQDKPFDVKEFATLKDFKAARQHILNTEFDGKEPTGFLGKGRLDAWANQYMWQQIGKFEGILENANYNAQQGAMTLDPAGVGGMLYHAILSVQASQKKRAEEFMQQAKEASLQAETWQEKLTANNKMALAYLYQFAAYNLTSLIGLKFARYAGNRLNQTISFIPGIGLARLNEKKGVPQEMHSAQIIANQAVGLLLLFTAHAILKAIADEPDEEKRGFGLSGSWDSLPPDKKSQLMSSGKQPYTITLGGHVFKYNNFPMGGVIAAIGSLADLVQYQPDKWNDKTLPGKLGSGFTAAMLSVSDSASLSQFSEMFGRSVQTRDPLDATINTLSKTAAGWAGGFIPRLLKDVDAMFSPAINRYKTPFEFMARELPVYRRSVGTPLLDIFAEPVAPSRAPLSREFITQPTEPEYRLIGDLNEHGVFLTPANPENRLVGKGKNKRHMTDEEGLRYITLSGKGYRDFVLKDAQRILTMPRAKARQYVLDKADAIRDRAAKQSVKRA